MTIQPRLEAGSRLGRYEIIGLLGAGGMAEVYRARDTKLNRLIAVKVLPAEMANDGGRLQRFEQEARLASALNHPNILTVHDVGTWPIPGAPPEQEAPFLITELLNGQTLREQLRSMPHPDPTACAPLLVDTAVAYALQIAEGLAAAHDAGIVHRDLKPENLFVTRDGRVKILDFGLAKLAPAATVSETRTTLTKPHAVLGTVGYMAPEQVRGDAVDHRADLFAFGVVLYEMLTGCPAFPNRSAPETFGTILHSEPQWTPRLAQLNPRLQALLRRCLKKISDRRLASAKEAVAALNGLAITTVPITEPRVTTRAMVTGIGAAALLAVSGLLVWHPWSRSTTRSTRQVVAVLPFDTISADKTTEYFSAGLAEEIMAQLSKTSSLRVISRMAVAEYVTDKTRRRNWDDLGVGSLVTGSVRTAASSARVHVQLVDARSDQTLWAEEYDRALGDVLSVERDVARDIASGLARSLDVATSSAANRPATRNADAYTRYLQAIQAAGPGDRTTTRTAERNDAAIVLLQDAVRIDPDFALAHALLSLRFAFKSGYAGGSYLDDALTEARLAVRLDPTSGHTHHALGMALSSIGKGSEARLSLLRAIELEPNFDQPLADLSAAEGSLGHYDQALYWARRGFLLAPNISFNYYHVAASLMSLEKDDVTERWTTESIKRFPEYLRLPTLLSYLDFVQGHDAEAIRRARQTIAREPSNVEARGAFTTLAFLTGAPDRESLIEEAFQRTPAELSSVSNETYRVLHASLLLQRAQPEKAAGLLDEAARLAEAQIRDGVEVSYPRVELAAISALRGRTDEAIKWLDEAYATGWRGSRDIDRDPLFASLRRESRFVALLDRMKNDIARMRTRIDVDANPQMPPISAFQ